MEYIRMLTIVLGSIMALTLFWAFVVWLIALLGGWSKLAAVYPARPPFNESCWSLQSARFRWSSYSGILKVCADAQALHLSVFPLFRPGHPPLSIPWEDISSRQRMIWVELRFYRAESVPVRIPPALAGRLEKASEGMWQYEKGG